MKYSNSAYKQKQRLNSLKNFLGYCLIILGLTIIYISTYPEIYSIKDNSNICIGACKPYIKNVKSEAEYINDLLKPYEGYKYLDKNNQKYIATFFYRNEGFYIAETALAVAFKESSFQSHAYHINKNGTVDMGCWQINSIHNVDNEIRLDCKASTNWIYTNLYLKKGFQPWSAYHSLVKI